MCVQHRLQEQKQVSGGVRPALWTSWGYPTMVHSNSCSIARSCLGHRTLAYCCSLSCPLGRHRVVEELLKGLWLVATHLIVSPLPKPKSPHTGRCTVWLLLIRGRPVRYSAILLTKTPPRIADYALSAAKWSSQAPPHFPTQQHRGLLCVAPPAPPGRHKYRFRNERMSTHFEAPLSFVATWLPCVQSCFCGRARHVSYHPPSTTLYTALECYRFAVSSPAPARVCPLVWAQWSSTLTWRPLGARAARLTSVRTRRPAGCSCPQAWARTSSKSTTWAPIAPWRCTCIRIFPA